MISTFNCHCDCSALHGDMKSGRIKRHLENIIASFTKQLPDNFDILFRGTPQKNEGRCKFLKTYYNSRSIGLISFCNSITYFCIFSATFRPSGTPRLQRHVDPG